jgi:hypothetical protein
MGFPLLELPEELILKVIEEVDDYATWKCLLEVPELMSRIGPNLTLITNGQLSNEKDLPFTVMNIDSSYADDCWSRRTMYAVEMNLAQPRKVSDDLKFCKYICNDKCFVNINFRLQTSIEGVAQTLNELSILVNAVTELDCGYNQHCVINGQDREADLETKPFMKVELQSPLTLKGHCLDMLKLSRMDITSSQINSTEPINRVEIKDCSSETVNVLKNIISKAKKLVIGAIDDKILAGTFETIPQTPFWGNMIRQLINEWYRIDGMRVEAPDSIKLDSIYELRNLQIMDGKALDEYGFNISTVPMMPVSTAHVTRALTSPVISGIRSPNLKGLKVTAYAKFPKFQNIDLPKLEKLRLVIEQFNDISYFEDINPHEDLGILRTVNDLSMINGLKLLTLNPPILNNLRILTIVLYSELEPLARLDELSLPYLEGLELGSTNKDIDWEFPPRWNLPSLNRLMVSVEAWPRSWDLKETSRLHPKLEVLCLAVPSDFGMVDITPDNDAVIFSNLERLTLCGVYFNKNAYYEFPKLKWTLLSVESPERFYNYNIEAPELSTLALELTGQLTRTKEDHREEIDIRGFPKLDRMYIDGFRKLSLFGTPYLSYLHMVSSKNIESITSDVPLLEMKQITIAGTYDVDRILEGLDFNKEAEIDLR